MRTEMLEGEKETQEGQGEREMQRVMVDGPKREKEEEKEMKGLGVGKMEDEIRKSSGKVNDLRIMDEGMGTERTKDDK
jgi:hypothetical protein